VHEVAIAQGILDVVLDVTNGATVRSVRVRAGEQQAVTQESLRHCFEMVAMETQAAHARLDVEVIPGDVLLVDAIELEDGWLYRPDAPDTEPQAEADSEPEAKAAMH